MTHDSGSTESTQGRGLVFVTELSDPDDGGRFSGEFAAHWESEDGEQNEMGPVEVTVEEAIRWGCMHSDVVLVQLGGGDDGHFSAGRRVFSDEETRPWPADGLKVAPRPEGSALDGSEQIVEWVVKAEIGLDAKARDKIAANLRTASQVVEAHSVNGTDDRIVLTVLANGATPAMTMAWRLIASAIESTSDATQLDDVAVGISSVTRAIPPE